MKRTEIALTEALPGELCELVSGAVLYDSSCSKEANVIFVDKGCGYYLKRAARGSLAKEAELTRYFHRKGLSAPVIEYLSLEEDWLLTERIDGEDATHELYLSDPKRLAVTSGELLRKLHETDYVGCPVKDRMKEYYGTVEKNYRRGIIDLSFSGLKSPEEAYRVAKEGMALLKSDTLIHGDYCLPNFLMKDWSFTGFVDLGASGVGDRHVDLFWGAWTLNFNLKTDKYRDIFFDAYGRELVDPDALRIIGAAEAFG